MILYQVLIETDDTLGKPREERYHEMNKEEAMRVYRKAVSNPRTRSVYLYKVELKNKLMGLKAAICTLADGGLIEEVAGSMSLVLNSAGVENA